MHYFINRCGGHEMENIKEPIKNDIEISIENVSMTYQADNGTDVKALTDINLQVKKGEFVALLGPSGCGKSTLLNIIADLLHPTEGNVIVGGTTPKDARLKQRYGIVFQRPVLFDWRTVQKNVELPLEIMKWKKEDRRERSTKMLGLVNLSDFANHYPQQLSGGMQQRVGIARALAINPEILLMDEPFSALDEFTKEKLHEDILRIWRKTHKTVVFVTHNIQEAVYLSDKIVVLSPHPGRVSAIIDVNETLPRPRVPEMKTDVAFNQLVLKVRNSFEEV